MSGCDAKTSGAVVAQDRRLPGGSPNTARTMPRWCQWPIPTVITAEIIVRKSVGCSPRVRPPATEPCTDPVTGIRQGVSSSRAPIREASDDGRRGAPGPARTPPAGPPVPGSCRRTALHRPWSAACRRPAQVMDRRRQRPSGRHRQSRQAVVRRTVVARSRRSERSARRRRAPRTGGGTGSEACGSQLRRMSSSQSRSGWRDANKAWAYHCVHQRCGLPVRPSRAACTPWRAGNGSARRSGA